ncbi:hypothetical protein VM1G_02210 [Cytospora mali]|uniref:Uncharacterized protein n=1 Tax=Cytospora mali TaxID=578113 RepID=A0A194VSR1_CYTMA|nr:hypothetical protein VM1G_02210 [Valsa mali]
MSDSMTTVVTTTLITTMTTITAVTSPHRPTMSDPWTAAKVGCTVGIATAAASAVFSALLAPARPSCPWAVVPRNAVRGGGGVGGGGSGGGSSDLEK